MKKLAAIGVSSALLFGSIGPANALAEAPSQVSQIVEVKNASKTEAADKQTLIKRVHELFPNKFNFLSEQDYHLHLAHRFPADNSDVPNYNLSFHKELNQGKYVHGSFEFIGNDLELTHYYYYSDDHKDALYPPKVTKEEALAISKNFLRALGIADGYQLNESNDYYYPSINRPLTEPIEYQFTFDYLKDNIPVEGNSISVLVLGNGEVTQFYKQPQYEKVSYDNINGILTKEEALEIWKNELDLELQYLVNYDYRAQKAQAYATYAPTDNIQGISANTGKLKVNGKLVDTLQERSSAYEPIANNSKAPKPITQDEAKKLAAKLLDPKEDGVRLVIEGILENKLPDGTTVYDIHYMLHRGNSGMGSSIQINKDTGELIHFHSARDYYMDSAEVKENISYEKALAKAIDYIHTYAYTKMDEFVKPISSGADHFYNTREHYIHFPRIKDGYIVQGDGISVSIDKEDGSLVSLNVNYTNIEEWPQMDQAVTKEDALTAYNENLDLQLKYVSDLYYYDAIMQNKPIEYELLYTPYPLHYQKFYNALTGDWENAYSYEVSKPDSEGATIEHPWAENELKYLAEKNIIKVDADFNPDKPLTKGEALEILMKSLVYIYDDFYPNQGQPTSPFVNITPEHEKFTYIKRAVEMNILPTDTKTFAVDDPLTREELAFWYVRALGLNELAQQANIFQLTFTDRDTISPEYVGHVVIANALGIMSGNGTTFNPKAEVTLAQLAVSNIRLAHAMKDVGRNSYY